MSHSSCSKRLKKNDSRHKDHFTSSSSNVFIIKLEPDRSAEQQSQEKNNALSKHKDAEHIEVKIDPGSLVNESVLSDDEIAHNELSDELSPSEQMQDNSEYDSDDDMQSRPFDLSQGTSQSDDSSKFDDSFLYRPVISFSEKSLQTSEKINKLITKGSQKRSVKDGGGEKKLRGWNASRGKLKFQKKWLKEYPFIEYDEENNEMFCKACRKYVNDFRKTSPFVIGNQNFRESMLKYHQRSSMHIECQELADTIANEGDEALDKDLYKEQLSHVFKSVYFIFKNKMPYTHYPQLCETQKREGTDFSVYTSHLKVVPLFGKFICMAFEKEVAKKLENVKEFSLIIDASFRRNIESHDLVYVKYLDNFMVKTVFLGVMDSSAKLHDSIYSILCDLFKTYSVTSWVNKVVYLMTDRSDCHMWLEGLISLIKGMSPENFFTTVNYLPHKIKYCASVVQQHIVTSTFDALLWSIYCYYEKVDKSKKNLTHMNKELDNIIECYGNLPKNSYTTLYYEALKAIEEDYGNLVQLLESEQLILNFDFKVRKAGGRILSAITRSGFLCKLAIFIDIFFWLNDFAVKISSDDILPYDIHMLLEEACANIEKAAAAEGPKCLEIGEELNATACFFRGVEVVEDGSIHHVLPEVKKFSQDVIAYMKSLVDDESLLEKSFIFNVSMWPEDDEIVTFGNDEFVNIFTKFTTDEQPSIVDALEEWKMFKIKTLSSFPFKVRQHSKSIIMKMVSEHEEEFPCVVPLMKKILLLNFECSEIKRGYHEMCLNKSYSRSMLSLQSLQTSMIISMYGPPLHEFDFSSALDLFLKSRHRKFRKKIIDKKLLFPCEDDNI